MLLVALNPKNPLPAYRQICDQIIARVEDGTLRPGDRIPPTRELAESIGVHRSTVVRAYDEIRALGYLESRPGSYTTIRRRARPPATATQMESRTECAVTWSDLATKQVRTAHAADVEVHEVREYPNTIDFERLAADPSLAPTEDLRRCARIALAGTEASTLDYADPQGWRLLREVVSLRLRAHGISVSADEVLITSGAQHGLDLILRLLTTPGDRVIVEAPTYGMAHTLLRLHGVAALEVPMSDTGMELDALEETLQTTQARLIYTMPNFHNPTGVTTDQPHRERLLGLCERHNLPLVEDGFEEEMKYFGKAVLPIKSMDVNGLVLYVGTFSKVIFPGLRVGWIAAPQEAISLLTSIQHASSLAVNTLAQAIAERFTRRGEFELYLRRIHRVYRRRMQVMLAGLETYLPPSIKWSRPAGGYTLWLTWEGTDEDSACESLRRAGVRVAPGSRFFGTPEQLCHARLSIACVSESQIQEGCRRLGSVAIGW